MWVGKEKIPNPQHLIPGKALEGTWGWENSLNQDLPDLEN